MYNTAIAEFEKTLTSSEVAGFKQYQTKVKRIKRGTYSPEAKELTSSSRWLNLKQKNNT